jgi:CRP-like cAMP-binding protein
MPVSDLIDLLARTALLQACTPDELAAIAAAGTLRAVEEDGFFFQQGDPAGHIYVLTAGRLRLTQVSVDGQQVVLRIIVPGQMFGAIGLTPGAAEYPCAAQAIEDSQALAWDNETFRAFCERNPKLSFSLMGLMTTYIQEMQSRFRELATERVEQRVARTLLRLAAQTGRKVENGVLVDMLLSHQELAEMAGTTLYTVSRLFSDWERRGLIETGREKVVIVAPHELVRIAEDLVK